MKAISPLVISLALAATLTVQSALYAQQLPIQAAPDGTGTIVNPTDNTFNITGGTTSGSGTNLFHSFTTFGLNNGQVANFLSAPNTQNILSRVTGGSSSFIDGLLKVSGSNANLYLLNPSGILFGPNASLNVPAAFTATTANGIAFGSQWFNAFGPNNYAALNGSPGALGFTMSKPGAIINAGNLSVGPGQALSLIGGTVASTGQLSGGQVTVAAVPGEHYVRLGQPGSPLSIEVPISGAELPTNWNLPIYSLPELLTGTNAGLTVANDGTVQLTNSQLTVEQGDVVAKKIDAETATLSASRNVTLPESQLGTTKDLLVQAKDTVTVRDSKENPVLVKAGGNLTIQGDKSIDILALDHPGQAFQSGGNLRLISDGNVSGDAHFGSGGKFSIETLAGKPGNFVSLYDPIISSGNDVIFGDYEGVSLKVESLGSITGGNITITGPELSGNLPPGNDTDILIGNSALILRAGTQLGNTNVPISTPLTPPGNITTTFNPGNTTTSPGNITVGSVTTVFGPIILAASGDITTNFSLTSNGGAISLNTSNGNISTKFVDSSYAGNGGNISLVATNGNISTGSFDSSGSEGTGGNISLAANGNISTGSFDSSSTFDTGGNISLAANGNITTDQVTFSFIGGNGGAINFEAMGNINTGNLATNGNAIALTSGGLIRAGTIDSSTPAAPGGGAITLSHKGTSFIVNRTPSNASSSSGTITSRFNNIIASGTFTGTSKQGNITIIGPDVPVILPEEPPTVNTPPTTGTSIGLGGTAIDPQTIKSRPQLPLSGPSTPILPYQPQSGEVVKIFEKYFGEKFTQKQFSLPELQDNLERLEKATGKKLAIINVDTESKILTLITPKDNTVVAIPLTVTSEALREKANLLRREIADPSNVTSSRYLTTSRQLYSWLIAPLEPYLQAKKVDTLIFQLDSGLRLTPLAALNDGKQFLVEKYAISLIPSINLLDTSYDPERVRASKVLAMGASAFKDDVPLPAVPAELRNVTQEAGGSVFLNENFTLGNLKAQTASYGLIHLATHADFNKGPVQGSYIKLSDTRLGLNQIRDLGWSQQKIELLVLSACRTAFGDSNTELGFAGLAVGAGVKTAVATLWRSSDLGTFGLMSDFYDELKTAPIKADALRAAQVALLRGEVRVENGQLRFKKATFPLPEDLKALGEVRLTHPYYWSGFTMIGSPW